MRTNESQGSCYEAGNKKESQTRDICQNLGSLKTVWNVINKRENTGELGDRKGPRMTSTADDRRMLIIMTKKMPNSSVHPQS